jgi:hypothetical protein
LEFDGKPDMAALLRWEVSAIPTSSTVESATITINVLNTSVDVYNLYQVWRPWEESGATFTEYSSGNPWQVPGAAGTADRGLLVLGTVTAPLLGTTTIDLNATGIAVIQSWINDPKQNHGLAFQDFTDARTDDLEISSKENADPQLRPKLSIKYHSNSYSSQMWRNPTDPYDANGDTAITPSDALVVINRLNQHGVIDLSKEAETRKSSGYYPDVNGDRMVTPVDALVVINYLTSANGGEGEATWLGKDPEVNAIEDLKLFVDHVTAMPITWPASATRILLRDAGDSGFSRRPAVALGRRLPESHTAKDTADSPAKSPQSSNTSSQCLMEAFAAADPLDGDLDDQLMDLLVQR